MKKFILILIIHCSLLITHCFAQSITWQRTYNSPFQNDDLAYDVCEANGDNYYLVGYASIPPYGYDSLWVLKINGYSDTLWSKFINGGRAFAVVSSGDGGCVLTGAYGVAFTIKLDSLGNIVWNKTYGGSNILCYDIIKTSDGGYLACGFSLSSAYDGYILKIDADGNLQWQKIVPATEIKSFYSVVEALDGGYLLAGAYAQMPYEPARAMIIKIDTGGNIIWEKIFKVNNSSTAASKIVKSNNFYIITGGIYDSIQRVFIARLNLLGDTTFAYIFNTTYQEYGGIIEIINPNKYIFTSAKDTISTVPSFSLLRIIDSVGNVIRQKSYFYGTTFHDGIEIISIHKISDNDFLFAGSRDYNFLSDMYALRTDTLLDAPPIGISNQEISTPDEFKLFSNFPNPFNSSTIIKFQLLSRSYIIIKIFDIAGKEVTVLVNNEYNKGTYEIKWNAENYATGIYFCILYLNNQIRDFKKFVLLK